VTDYYVLDPDTDAAVLVELPIEERGYWMAVDHEAAISLVERFRKFVDGAPTPPSKPASLGTA